MIEENVRKQTTIYIPEGIRLQVKSKGMTVTGAFLAGWEAIQDRVRYAARIEELEADNRDMARNIRSMQRMLADRLQDGDVK